ncbi:MAG: GxxExxY protein [Candidatus Sumerlaeaceae bacterium]|nr:GxxExxY protein [Candidatus Sumerlaeaceae bacterium]
MRVNEITDSIIGAAIEVHKALGPGLLESAYEACLMYELVNRGLKVERQKGVPLAYKEVNLDCGFRADLIVEELVVVELKAKESLHPIDTAQLLSYLKILNLQVGLLINFHVEVLTKGIKRVSNNYAG